MIVVHAYGYCRRVPHKTSGWWGSPGSVSADPTVDAVVHVYNEERFPGWTFTVTFSPAGRPVGFAVVAHAPVDAAGWPQAGDAPRHPREAPGITARWLRSLPLAEIQETARKAYIGRRTTGPPDLLAKSLENWARIFADTPRPGRRGRDDRAYAEMAALYVAELERNPTFAVQALAERLHYARTQVRSVLTEARRRQLLTKPMTPGRAGGELTDKAKRLLQEG